jgi:hypothetical protein
MSINGPLVRILCLLLGIVNEIGFTNKCLIFSSLLIVYIGLYGYEYWMAGSKVYQLFQARGWSVILNDQLLSRSLGMMQFFIGLISGGVSIVLGLVVLGLSVSPLATFFYPMAARYGLVKYFVAIGDKYCPNGSRMLCGSAQRIAT